MTNVSRIQMRNLKRKRIFILWQNIRRFTTFLFSPLSQEPTQTGFVLCKQVSGLWFSPDACPAIAVQYPHSTPAKCCNEPCQASLTCFQVNYLKICARKSNLMSSKLSKSCTGTFVYHQVNDLKSCTGIKCYVSG